MIARAARPVLGAVLAGGASSRFGSNKADARWRDATLADHAAEALAPFVTNVVRVGGEHGLPDLPRSGLGPLGGIATALDHGRRHGFGSVLTIACDMPRVPTELIEALLAQAPACCADAPVLGHWPADLADDLLVRLAPASGGLRSQGEARPRDRRSGALSIRRWATDVGARLIPAPAALPNINTPADLAAL